MPLFPYPGSHSPVQPYTKRMKRGELLKTKSVNRIPEGVPTGGQFAEQRHGEPDVTLGANTEDARAANWNARFLEVLEYVGEHGSMPTHNPAKPESNKLASWLNDQRRSQSPISEERAKLLNRHVPGWDDPREARWKKRFEEVSSFKETEGHLPAAGKESTTVSSYGRWLVYQRKNEHKLPAHRIEALDRMDPNWRDPNPLAWSKNVDRAVDVVKKLGRFPTWGSQDPDDHRVAEWLSSQRTHYNRMTREQVRELDSRLPGWNHGREHAWRAHLAWTSDFVNRNGRFPSQHSNNMIEASHAAWVRAQRRADTNLTDIREAMLDESLPGWRR